jgi:hypothetical protein
LHFLNCRRNHHSKEGKELEGETSYQCQMTHKGKVDPSLGFTAINPKEEKPALSIDIFFFLDEEHGRKQYNIRIERDHIFH